MVSFLVYMTTVLGACEIIYPLLVQLRDCGGQEVEKDGKGKACAWRM